MNQILRTIYTIMAIFTLTSYNIVSSFILFFIPRFLRRKKEIKGQLVLITGAGSGVGRELAIEFSKHATCLILVDINREALLQTEKLLERCSPVFIYDCDVSDFTKVYEMAKQVQKDAGDVDILVNNAGIVSGGFLLELPEEKIVKTMQVNTLAHFWTITLADDIGNFFNMGKHLQEGTTETCKAFLPAMMKKNQGHIVNIISVAAHSGGPQLTDYCASKHAAMGFTESLAMELRLKKMDGIKVTDVCPSVINTKLFEGVEFPVGNKMSPSYVAKEVIAGVLEDEETIFLPRYISFVIKIKHLLPRWIFVKLCEIAGFLNIMDNFKGREITQNGVDIIKEKSKKKE